MTTREEHVLPVARPDEQHVLAVHPLAALGAAVVRALEHHLDTLDHGSRPDPTGREDGDAVVMVPAPLTPAPCPPSSNTSPGDNDQPTAGSAARTPARQQRSEGGIGGDAQERGAPRTGTSIAGETVARFSCLSGKKRP